MVYVKHLDHCLHDGSRITISSSHLSLGSLNRYGGSIACTASCLSHFLKVANCSLQIIFLKGKRPVFFRESISICGGVEGHDQILGQPRLCDIAVNEPILQRSLDSVVINTASEQ